MYRMCDFNNLDKLTPCLIEDTECIRKVHSYIIKKLQFMESTGIHIIREDKGLTILKVVVSGVNHIKDITHTMLHEFHQKDCPLEKIEIDTGKINEYAHGDVECGTRKLIQIDYMCDDGVYEEKKLRRVENDDEYSERKYDPSDCDNNSIEPPPDFTVIGHSAVYLINRDKCCTTTTYSRHEVPYHGHNVCK